MNASPDPRPLIWINAGETSGDMHGALLVRALRKINPDTRFVCMGGDALKQAGCEIKFSIEELSVMGFTEVFTQLPRIIRLIGRVKREIRRLRPDAVVLIDSPDFNFFIAKRAKKMGIPVFYYISPQVWAWRSGRVKFLKKYADRVISILPFEKDFYAERGVDVDYVGHPLTDQIPMDQLRRVKPDPARVVLLPGSRKKEVRTLLPEFAKAALIMRKRLPGLKFTVVRAPTVSDRAIKDGLPPGLPVDVVPPDKRYLSMRESALAVAASGTVALEAALLQTPTIVAYRLSPLTFLLGRLLVRVPHISLPNLILGERLFPELLQGGAEGGNIARHALAWLDNPDEMSRVRQRLADLADMIGEPGAPRRAAEIILARIAAGADENTP